MSLPLLHAGKSAPGLSAALDLRFALDKSLTAYRGPTPSFSRASTGTYFNSSGVLTSAAINAPRFDHTYNGTSWVSKGLLVEEQRTNSLNYSEDFSNAYWPKFNSPTLTANTSETTSPDGTNSATKVVSGTTTETDIYKTGLYSGSAAITFSIYAKAGATNFFGLQFYGTTADFIVNFDLSNGTYNQRVLTGYTGTSISMISVGNGWYRCSLTVTNPSVSTGIYVYCCTNSLSTSATTSGNSNYFFGAQFEVGSFATSYIKSNSGSSTTRSADVCQITGGDFSGFWNGTEGTVAAEFDYLNPSQSKVETPFLFNNTTSENERIWLSKANASPYGQRVVFTSGSSNVAVLSVSDSIPVAGQTYKTATGFKLNDFAASLGGNAVATDLSGSMPSVSQLSIGYYPPDTSVAYLNGHIARLRYFNKRLPNATLQQLST